MAIADVCALIVGATRPHHLPEAIAALDLKLTDDEAAALTGGFQRALWVCGLTALAAIPVAFVLIRRTGKS